MFTALAAACRVPGQALAPALGAAFRRMSTESSELKSVLAAAIPAEQVGT